ncbi:hypothetical protein FPOAC2_07826 [Fusarium poae]|uniref:hypothetical protein n=1 Tax=Fusarium poae TaxID=36050 RepID=UPI001CEA92AC|nr:hypothetical protein FPOAC1_007918 [Fusarium poae]KAG8668535.1 hypothetical protein FPOAC1_007918 [Fusarium poae]
MSATTQTAEFKAMTKETYWPVLKSSLLNGNISFEDLDLDCPICYDKMGVHETRDGNEDHRATILPCGHMIGNVCLTRGGLETCPICRADITHPSCQHPFEGMIMPARLRMLNTVPEELSKGGYITDQCRECRVGEMANNILEDLSEMDTESRGRRNLPPRHLGMVLTLDGHRVLLGGECPKNMKLVSIDTPRGIKYKWHDFEEGEYTSASEGLVWFGKPTNAKIKFHTFEESNTAVNPDDK